MRSELKRYWGIGGVGFEKKSTDGSLITPQGFDISRSSEIRGHPGSASVQQIPFHKMMVYCSTSQSVFRRILGLAENPSGAP